MFPIIIAFNSCINYTCRHNILLKIYICTNPTGKWLGKMFGKMSKMRKSGLTLRLSALLGRGSKDIYADICAVYGSYERSSSIVCRWVRKFSAGEMGQEI